MTPPCDPDSGKGRVPHRDHAREVTRPGPHVIGDLDATEDDFGAHTPVEELTAAAQDVGDAARALAAHAISRDEAAGLRMRIANLETWRKGTDEWRLKLTGVADGNGRIGTLARDVDKLREDVGSTDDRRKERDAIANLRGDRKRVVAAILAAATIAGGGIYTIRDRYDAAAEARGADAEWRRHVDESLRTLFGLRSYPP
ncbi:MAG: hypothetical protein IPH44_33075 [Myxococcales bacterium]|nr:hypothetical protein [Myxococcales bacterium]